MKLKLKYKVIFLKTKEKIPTKQGRRLATNAMKNPGGPLEIEVKNGCAFVPRNPKSASSTVSNITDFYNADERLYLGVIE